MRQKRALHNAAFQRAQARAGPARYARLETTARIVAVRRALPVTQRGRATRVRLFLTIMFYCIYVHMYVNKNYIYFIVKKNHLQFIYIFSSGVYF